MPVPPAAGTGIGVAGAREDDHLVLGITAHVAEGLGKLAVGQEPPLQGPAAGVKRHLEDAVAPFHADGLVLRRVVVKARHQTRSPSAAILRRDETVVKKIRTMTDFQRRSPCPGPVTVT